MVCMETEGKQIADILLPRGIAAIVVKYRLPNGHHLVPANDARRAIRTVRHNATTWNINPGRVGVWGFSAGGHLASTAGTHFDVGNSNAAEPVERVSCRPDFMILVYPVITMGSGTHQGSKNNLLGRKAPPKLVELFSNEKQVTTKTPPAFLAHAVDDRPVPPENSRQFYAALKSKKVSATETSIKTVHLAVEYLIDKIVFQH